jgi:hypothetical protein
MPKDGKTYMRCKRSGKTPDVKPVQKTELSKMIFSSFQLPIKK